MEVEYLEDGDLAIFNRRKYRRDKKTGIQKRLLAPKNVGASTVGVISIRPIGRANVYNMEVDGYHNFAVNGGLIVHNCMDEIRYFVNTIMVRHGGTTIGW